MWYEIKRLNTASLFISTLAEDLEANRLGTKAKSQAKMELVEHIERLILVAQKLKGDNPNAKEAQRIASQI